MILAAALGAALPGIAAAVPPEDTLRQLRYQLGPAVLMTRPARGAAPRFDLPLPRETHRRSRVRVDDDRAVARIHQVFFNASYQRQEALLLVPDPGPEAEVRLEVRTPVLEAPPPVRPLDATLARDLAREWALGGGNPGPLARTPGPALVYGPIPFGPGLYMKVDWRFELRLGAPPGGLRVLAMAPGLRPVKPLGTNAFEVDLPEELRSHAYSPTHRMLQRAGGKGRVVLEPVVERLPPDAPFLLAWPARPGQPGLVRGADAEGTPHPCSSCPPERPSFGTAPGAGSWPSTAGAPSTASPSTRPWRGSGSSWTCWGPRTSSTWCPSRSTPSPSSASRSPPPRRIESEPRPSCGAGAPSGR